MWRILLHHPKKYVKIECVVFNLIYTDKNIALFAEVKIKPFMNAWRSLVNNFLLHHVFSYFIFIYNIRLEAFTCRLIDHAPNIGSIELYYVSESFLKFIVFFRNLQKISHWFMKSLVFFYSIHIATMLFSHFFKWD